MGDRYGLWEFDDRKYTTDGKEIYIDEADKIISQSMPSQSQLDKVGDAITESVPPQSEHTHLDKVGRFISDFVPLQSDLSYMEYMKALERAAEEMASSPYKPVDMRPRQGRTEEISEIVKKYLEQRKEDQQRKEDEK